MHKIIGRLLKQVTRRGVRVDEEGSTHLADSDSDGDSDSDDARALRPLQAAARTYRVAFGPRAGQKVFTVQAAMPRDAAFTQALCAEEQGFSLHAAVRCAADDSQALERRSGGDRADPHAPRGCTPGRRRGQQPVSAKWRTRTDCGSTVSAPRPIAPAPRDDGAGCARVYLRRAIARWICRFTRK